MPRRIDYTKGNATDWDEVTLPEPVYGEREITKAEYEAMAQARGGVVDGFWPQFSTYGKKNPFDRAAAMDVAHAWLSDNATGPWSWHESWSNHGHAIDTHVYVEREPDQAAFLAAHGDIFRFHASTSNELRKTALLRGVATPLTARESFHVWCRDHAGFRFVPDKDLPPLTCRIAFDHAGMEAAFAAAFGTDFVAEADGRGTAYVGREDAKALGVPLTVWLDRNACVGSMAGGPTSDGYRWRVQVRYPDVGDALQQDWGHHFVADPTRPGTYIASGYPAEPERPLPGDYLAYLRGEAETYDAPHLHPSLAGPPSAPSPIR